jgi:hypothetical protein
MPPRLRSGDVLEIEFPKVPSPELVFPDGGFGYLTYVGKDHHKCDAVRVRPGILYERPSITEQLFADSYILFYPANLALRHKLVTVVGKLAPVPMPTVFRRSGWIERGGKITSWFIDDENGTTTVGSLTDEQKKINIAVHVNHEALLYQISKNWKPEKSVDSLKIE